MPGHYKNSQARRHTYALGVLAEATVIGVPIVVLPFASTALAGRVPFRRSVGSLRAEGVKILHGLGGFQPHPPRTGEGLVDSYPWSTVTPGTSVSMKPNGC